MDILIKKEYDKHRILMVSVDMDGLKCIWRRMEKSMPESRG